MSFSSDPSNYTMFYILDPPNSNKYYWVSPDSVSLHGRWFPRSLVDFKGVVEFSVQRGGGKAGDLIWGGASILLASSRVMDLLSANGMTGFSTYQARIVRGNTVVEGYSGLAVSGRGGPNDPKAYAGGFIPGTTIRRIDGLHPTQWDGSDFFTLDDIPGAVLVTERVKKLLVKEKVTNCNFRPSHDFSVGKDM